MDAKFPVLPAQTLRLSADCPIEFHASRQELQTRQRWSGEGSPVTGWRSIPPHLLFCIPLLAMLKPSQDLPTDI